MNLCECKFRAQSLLTLKNAGRDNDSGKYYVVVTNNYGSVTSLSAELQFIDVIPLAEALDASMLIWSIGGDANYFQSMLTNYGPITHFSIPEKKLQY
mgnify:CR=1 FL=1